MNETVTSAVRPEPSSEDWRRVIAPDLIDPAHDCPAPDVASDTGRAWWPGGPGVDVVLDPDGTVHLGGGSAGLWVRVGNPRQLALTLLAANHCGGDPR